MKDVQIISGVIIDDDQTISFTELCTASHADADFIEALIEQELIQPQGKSQADWRFDALCLRRSRLARSFHEELHVNMQGVALALDLLQQIQEMETQLAHLHKLSKPKN